MTPPSLINLAFIGSGSWARKYHFPALAYLQERHADLRLRGITSLELDRARAVAQRYGFQRVYADVDALLADDAVNAVAVAVPPAAVKAVLLRVVARGVPILSEKPPGISLQEAQTLSERITVPNVLAFNRRYAPLNNRFLELVADQRAQSEIHFVDAHFLRHARTDAAFMIGTGIHWINYLTYLFGEIAAVDGVRFPNPANATWVREARLTFADGLRGRLKVLPCSGSQVERLEVHSNAQSAYLYGPLWDDPGQIVVETGDARRVIDAEATQPLPEIVRLGIVGEYEEFLAVVRGQAAARSTFQNAVNSMRVAEAMEQGEGF
jgi:predicted dehydrogenase